MSHLTPWINAIESIFPNLFENFEKQMHHGEWVLPIQSAWVKPDESIEQYIERLTPKLPFSLDDAVKFLNPSSTSLIY